MNRFERLFFILERNAEDFCFGNHDVRGVVKIVLTEKQMRIMWEMNGLPIQTGFSYALAVFIQKAGTKQLQPQYFPFQPNQNGNARTEMLFSYQLQEGETVVGVGLSVAMQQADTPRKFPLIAFQNMNIPWREMLQTLHAVEKPKQMKKPPEVLSPEEKLNGYFSSYDPFGTTNPAYRWWKNADMHRLNQVLAELELSLPLELNKDGYLACGLFGHVLLGLYTDKNLKREFFILGIPAKCKEDSGNYYSHSRWEEIGKQMMPEQEETGYWLTYIDCATSKVVKVV